MKIILLLSILVISCTSIQAEKGNSESQPPFDVCFVAWPNTVLHLLPASGRLWIDALAEDYHATGICLSLPWSFIESGPGKYRFGDNKSSGMSFNIDLAIETILDKGMNLYVRVNMGSLPGDGTLAHATLPDSLRLDVSESTNDFFWNKSGVARNPTSGHSEKLVSFFSSRGEARLLRMYSATVTHIAKLAAKLKRTSQLKEIVPVISWHSETEYPWQFFVDFSDSAQERFRAFLARKYTITGDSHGFQKLLGAWGPPRDAAIPASIQEIDTRKYNWADAADVKGNIDPTGYRGSLTHKQEEYIFPEGGLDWMEFRTEALTGIIKQFADVNNKVGVRCCVQIGSPFDNLIEKRGWYDITPLLEPVGGIRTANIVGRKATFEFESDLLRSICQFWKDQTGKEYVFSTETNWPGYDRLNADTLIEAWSDNYGAFYESGSDAHFLAGWGSWGADAAGKRQEDYIETYRDEYRRWAEILGQYAGKPRMTVARSPGVYFNTERATQTHGYTAATTPFADHCDLFLWMVDKERGKHGNQIYERVKRRDIVTPYMLARDPAYLQHYVTSADTIKIEKTPRD
jgi:hypothetical protein